VEIDRRRLTEKSVTSIPPWVITINHKHRILTALMYKHQQHLMDQELRDYRITS